LAGGATTAKVGLRNANSGEEKKSQHLFFKFQTQSGRIKRHQVIPQFLLLGLMILLGTPIGETSLGQPFMIILSIIFDRNHFKH